MIAKRNRPAGHRHWNLAVILIAGLLITLPGFGHSPSPRQQDDAPIEKVLKPGDSLEECVLVRTSHRLQYAFHTSADVEFNIHYHDKQQNRIVYLVEPTLVDVNPAEHQHTVQEPRIVCLMWDNKQPQAISVTYSYTLTGI